MVALIGLIAIVAVVILAPWIAPYDPLKQDLASALQGPSRKHWFGTDELGRDVFSRVLYGGRVSLRAAVQAILVGIVLGLPLGLIAGYLGKAVDYVIMRFTDALMSFPPMILMLAMVAALGRNLNNAMLALGIVFAPRFARLARGVVLELREEPYIEAAQSIGVSTPAIIWRHIIPNALPPLIVQLSLSTGFAILAEAGLSFLGLGVQPPQASWGTMLERGFRSLSQSSTLIVFPGIAVALTVLAFNVIGDGLRESIGREIRTEPT